jgi:hypothetical protein
LRAQRPEAARQRRPTKDSVKRHPERILRLIESQSGLALEQKLAPTDAVVRQKEKLLSAFQAAPARLELSAAQ